MTPDERAALAAIEEDAVNLCTVANNIRQRIRQIVSQIPDPPVASSLTISPTTFGVAEAATVQLTATVYDQFGNEMAGQTVTWSSSNAGVASVNSSSGLVTGVAAGTCSITASVTGANLTTPASCTVSPAAVASVSVTPASASLNEGSTTTVTFQPKDASGNSLAGRTVTGSTADAGTATISVNGYTGTITGVLAGSTTVKGTCETIDSGNVSVTVNAVAGSLTPNLPSGMTLHIDSDLSGVTLDATISSQVSAGQAAGNMGITYDGTGGANCRVRSTATQASWRNALQTAFPSCPNGYDLVHECRFGATDGSAYSIAAGEKGRYLMNLPANCKSLYLAGYFLISSNWYGQSGSGDWKKWYLRTQSEGPSILGFKGATTGNIRLSAYVGAHCTNVAGATDTALNEAVDNNLMVLFQRNQWRLVEMLAVTESSSNAGDAHLTYWVDGVKLFQVTSMNLTTGGGGNLVWIPSCELLHYYGGGGTTNVPISNGPLSVLTGDHLQIYYSTSHLAVP